jgi:hypothetical protein
MTGIDLIVLAPWIVFGIGLAVICILLLRSRRAPEHRLPRPPRPCSHRAGTAAQPDRASAAQEPASCPNPQEAKCPEKNAETRPQ